MSSYKIKRLLERQLFFPYHYELFGPGVDWLQFFAFDADISCWMTGRTSSVKNLAPKIVFLVMYNWLCPQWLRDNKLVDQKPPLTQISRLWYFQMSNVWKTAPFLVTFTTDWKPNSMKWTVSLSKT